MGTRKSWDSEQNNIMIELFENGYTLSEVAEQLGRTEGSVETHCNRIKYTIPRKHGAWTDKKKAEFTEDWKNQKLTIKDIAEKYKLTIESAKHAGVALGLGGRLDYREELLFSDIVEGMGVTRDRVRYWVRHGLKTKKCKAGNAKHVVKVEELLKFLEWHQNLFDASKIKIYMFASTPDWLAEKKKNDCDKEKRVYKEYSLWSEEQKQLVIDMGKANKSVEEIAKAVNKSEEQVLRRLGKANLRYKDPKFWTGKQLKILRLNHDSKTCKEMSEMMNNERTEQAVQAKCRELNYSYKLR